MMESEMDSPIVDVARPISQAGKMQPKRQNGKKATRNNIFDSQFSKNVLFRSKIVNSLNCTHKELCTTSDFEGESAFADAEKLSGKIRCSMCNVVFDNFIDQRTHFKTDWHVYNVKRKILSKEAVDENEFHEKELIINSIDPETDDSVDYDSDDDKEERKSTKDKDSRIHFITCDNRAISLYKCILETSKEYCRNCVLYENSLKKISIDNCWLILMFSGGHFAAAVFHKNDVIEHKTIHRYTVRAKRGTSQSIRDAKQHGKTPRSAGATIRRQNEATLVMEIQELLRRWKDHIDHSKKIFIKWPQNLKSILFGGKSPIFEKTDTRFRKIPFMTGKPTFGELKRIHFQLTTVHIKGKMASKAIREADAKALIYKYTKSDALVQNNLLKVDESTDVAGLTAKKGLSEHKWLDQRLVVKPDQLIKRRGKHGLIKVNVDLNGIQNWLNDYMGKEIEIGKAKGKLKHFIVEPFITHEQEEECYVCIFTQRNADVILFHHQGGVDVGDVDKKALRLIVNIDEKLSDDQIKESLLKNISDDMKPSLCSFIHHLYMTYVDLHFTYLEINPLVVTQKGIYILDVAAKLDQAAEYLCSTKWGKIEFPPPFGREAYPEEDYIAELDAKSGASLKLTVLNRNGRIWTMVAGGGASVVYSDTICELGGTNELANYGEYSGAPTESQTFQYAKTILKLMTDGRPFENGKILIIGGGIANFTNVSATFSGIVKALQLFQQQLINHKVTIFVRRGGPNYQEGLRIMRELGKSLGVPMHVFGTETHMTAIVGMALGKSQIPEQEAFDSNDAANMFFSPPEHESQCESGAESPKKPRLHAEGSLSEVESNDFVMIDEEHREKKDLFSDETKAIIWGMQPRAVQGMLDFDYVCSRSSPSVVASVYPFSGNHKQKFYYGHKEIMIPVYKDMCEAMKKHPDADVMVNFASLRSAFESTVEAMSYPQIRCIAIIAEGIPERLTQRINKMAAAKDVTIIGPATVGGIKPGCFKIGNTGGMLDNILASKLYRQGSVGYVSRSGGLSNELNNIIARNTDGVCEGVAIGGDRYPGSTFIDHVMRYQNNPDIKMIVLLGEVGGVDEYEICRSIKGKKITKPVVAWVLGTCADMFTSEVQFGHANACANAEGETATAKNKALRAAGAFVPDTFDDLGVMINKVYKKLLETGQIVPKPEKRPPTVPMDYNWAQELGLIRKPSSFISTICDERGQELLYAGVPITDVFKDDLGIGGTLGLLWFQRRLPMYACHFIEMCIMLTADHGPAVSGAHNTIVTARAGKDLMSSLCSGLLTIGDRFGGALDAAAKQFSTAHDDNKTAMEFVNEMRKKGQLIMGIGHRVKSINNPDRRVEIMKSFIKENFPKTPLFDFALEVEKITTAKKPNLILNVDGCIGTAFVDLLRYCGSFSKEEADEYIAIGALNGLFVLGRSIGFIGHFLDQRRLKQGLYRHPWDDITYMQPDHLQRPAPFE